MKISLPAFDNANVLVVGDLMLDRYWHGGSSRISPEAPVQVVNVGQIEERPGGAGNVALNIASLGSAVTLVGITGNDEAADSLQTRLTAANVTCDFERVNDVPTITKLRVISRQQQLIRLDFEESLQGKGNSGLSEKMTKHVNGCGAIILSDYAKGTLDNVQALIKIANDNQIPVLVDPKGTDFVRYRGATLVTPNLHEFEAIVGECSDEQTLVEKGLQLLEQYDWKALLVTRGEHGMTLLRKEQPELHLPALSREVFDVTGAGDTVIATLASALAAGSPLEEAVALSNIAAGIVVVKLGTATVSAHELRRKLRTAGDSGTGVMTAQQLQIAVEEAQAHGEKIVMTNGCFDILHAGHVAYLKQAKALGHRLIVAVNDDDSVRRLKGDGRPVNPCERRMSVLAALGSVDWVVSFDEDTPRNLITEIMPDVLVKGGDYKVEQIAGAKEVLENGGQVEILQFVDGVSTTGIIESINQKNNE
ncbi:bifunctional D-glycero-beta-D-manno-heptose-7-phosphate kinase/D-glycero-beta-D-manno-heptose 1-phosphate adenylyltransferase HldE [Aliikangiella coralliicola]|uniref:Bifunctional protein HldE n=1 Tax=Aliikangiella coralliicola TaxID=2592383 RepID=A0A545UH17_9GAMM|nr:bifunctional D-glycero-beta-D-manno-heptose-7-phosphate kinase/D-glycero-beta-D-manno-heptose 1-phosphate adenylyltransferase HldE [Aliikangiella coralliicola]TQV88764.1 bifunctional D-glycero-beta-D-manno-heptose-7-phosphate kinase/D-glycero-beta-D-manno-heptose 1-phosphate adenylyltransferase HldE [Aliikangiella coralliicola]